MRSTDCSKRCFNISLRDKLFGDTGTVPWMFHCCQNCRKTSGFFWQQFQPKNPVPGSCHRGRALQQESLLEQMQERHLAFIILFLCQPWNLPVSLCVYAIPKCKCKGSGIYTTRPVWKERLNISRVANLPGCSFRPRKVSLSLPMAWDQPQKEDFTQFRKVHFHHF